MISINNINYDLFAIVTHPIEKHYVSYLKNRNYNYKDSVFKWFKYDDLVGFCKELKL